MLRVIFLGFFILVLLSATAQVQTQVIGDSVFLHGNTGKSELILQNSTDSVNGFLFNKGAGRTEFRRALFKINDSTYLIGADTLYTHTGGSLSGTYLPIATTSSTGVISVGKGLIIDSTGKLAASTSLFKRGSVPYAGPAGSLIQDTTGFVYDGNNLSVGHGGFSNNTTLTLNGGNGQINAGGFGLTITASGGFPADPSKSIWFYNSGRPWLRMWMPDGGIANVATTTLEGMAYMHWYPAVTDSFNLGLPAKEWNNAYVKNLYVNGSLFTGGGGGTATLISGTVTVSTALIKTGAKIFVSVNTPGGAQGFLSAPSANIINATSFKINSTSATDASTVNWQIIN